MKCLVMKYFKDESGEWHQPGNVLDLDRDRAESCLARGNIKIIQTQMAAPPETRVVAMRARGRKRNESGNQDH